MGDRTVEQREANDLDLAMFRVVERLDQFATGMRHGPELNAVDEAVSSLRAARHVVRSRMHKDDVERTS